MSDERRTSARILTDFSLVLLDDMGVVIDDHAVAHDLSAKGFRAEMHGEIAEKQAVRYRLSLPGRELAGRGRAAWIQRTDFSVWVGVEFQGLSWSDRRLLKQATSRSSANWVLIGVKAVMAVIWGGGLIALFAGLRSNFWRPQMLALAPKVVAAFAVAWALLELAAPDR